MKSSVFISFLCLILFCGCKKKETPPEESHAFSGKWHLKKIAYVEKRMDGSILHEETKVYSDSFFDFSGKTLRVKVGDQEGQGSWSYHGEGADARLMASVLPYISSVVWPIGGFQITTKTDSQLILFMVENNGNLYNQEQTIYLEK